MSFFINGESYCDTYIYGGSNETSSLTVTCPILQAPFLFWNSSVAGPIPSGVTDIQGVNITNAGANLTINAFVPALSGVYTCSDGYSTASSILLTTSKSKWAVMIGADTTILVRDGTGWDFHARTYSAMHGEDACLSDTFVQRTTPIVKGARQLKNVVYSCLVQQ